MGGISASENGVVEILRSQGFEVVSRIWDEWAPQDEKFDAIIIRSPWDYFEKLEKFKTWLNFLPVEKVYNPVSILKWNLDKIYLQELEKKGVQIVPTDFFTIGKPGDLKDHVESKNWEKLVVKPSISAAAFKTYRFTKNNIPDDEQYLNQTVLLQPCLPEIEAVGEISLLFFGGKYSHGVLKRPSSGDFRVQYLYGGTEEVYHASENEICFGEKILDSIPKDLTGEPLLYARVDYVLIQGVPHLMELEVLEPDLFFRMHSVSAELFCNYLNLLIK